MTKKVTTEEFITRAKAVHSDRYSYSKTSYVNNFTNVIITCLVHGDFEQLPKHHERGSGCQLCNGPIRKSLTTEEFIAKAKAVHGDKYDYSKVSYIANKEKVIIVCSNHGDFEQRAGEHLRGKGCPVCKFSKAERIVDQYLEKNNYVYSSQVQYPDCKNKMLLRFDFAIRMRNGLPMLLEIDGAQHHEEIYSQASFNAIKKNDAIKNNYCATKDLLLTRIEYKRPYNKSSLVHVIRQLEDALQRYDVPVESIQIDQEVA